MRAKHFLLIVMAMGVFSYIVTTNKGQILLILTNSWCHQNLKEQPLKVAQVMGTLDYHFVGQTGDTTDNGHADLLVPGETKILCVTKLHSEVVGTP